MQAVEANILSLVEDFENNEIITLLKEKKFRNIFDFFQEHQRTLIVDLPDIVIFETAMYSRKNSHLK